MKSQLTLLKFGCSLLPEKTPKNMFSYFNQINHHMYRFFYDWILINPPILAKMIETLATQSLPFCRANQTIFQEREGCWVSELEEKTSQWVIIHPQHIKCPENWGFYLHDSRIGGIQTQNFVPAGYWEENSLMFNRGLVVVSLRDFNVFGFSPVSPEGV